MIKYFTTAYLARYYIQTETQPSIYHGPAGPACGMGCVQAEKARAQDVPNLENLVKQISESAVGEFFFSPFVSSYIFDCRSMVIIRSFVH